MYLFYPINVFKFLVYFYLLFPKEINEKTYNKLLLIFQLTERCYQPADDDTSMSQPGSKSPGKPFRKISISLKGTPEIPRLCGGRHATPVAKKKFQCWDPDQSQRKISTTSSERKFSNISSERKLSNLSNERKFSNISSERKSSIFSSDSVFASSKSSFKSAFSSRKSSFKSAYSSPRKN